MRGTRAHPQSDGSDPRGVLGVKVLLRQGPAQKPVTPRRAGGWRGGVSWRSYLHPDSKIRGIGSDPQRIKAAPNRRAFCGFVISDSGMGKVLPVCVESQHVNQMHSTVGKPGGGIQDLSTRNQDSSPSRSLTGGCSLGRWRKHA